MINTSTDYYKNNKESLIKDIAEREKSFLTIKNMVF